MSTLKNLLTLIHVRNQKVIQVIITETHWTLQANLTLVTQMMTQNPVTPPSPSPNDCPDGDRFIEAIMQLSESLRDLQRDSTPKSENSRLETLTLLMVLTLGNSVTSLYYATFILGIVLKSLLLTRTEFYLSFLISKVQHLVGLNQDLTTP